MPSNDFRRNISDAFLADENAVLADLANKARMNAGESRAAAALAHDLIVRLRGRSSSGDIDSFLQEYALSSEEGVVLLCLAEALLRVPDAETANRLIQDKIAGRDWKSHLGHSASAFVNASTWALMLTGRIVDQAHVSGWDFDAIWRGAVARLGEPVIRQAMTAAIRMLGRHFVLGRTIEEALREAAPLRERGYRFSFDMLGESVCTAADAERCLDRYRHAVAAIAGFRCADGDTAALAISVKLTALHPRFEDRKRHHVLGALLEPLVELCAEARAGDVAVTIDAEEAERLDLTLDIFEGLGDAAALKGWNGLGLAVQAYQKRALPVIAWLDALARRQQRNIPVRLVKGAYWDAEIKRAQELGLPDFPVFTRKAGTDTSYLACARALLAAPDLFPQFATHNANTIAAVEALAGKNRGFEFQRLHGMGEALYELYKDGVERARPAAPVRIYAPVGSHEDLLSYLVRRLLENGANSSFVNRLADRNAPAEKIIVDPVARIDAARPKRNPRIAKPGDLFPGRRNSQGLLLADAAAAMPLVAAMRDALERPQTAYPVIGGRERHGETKSVLDPADRRRIVGAVGESTGDDARAALESAAAAQESWNRRGGAERARILERAADGVEQNRPLLMALLVREAGRVVQDALSETREAVDFLRYYAAEARLRFAGPAALPGPSGEQNELSLRGAGVFACIAPWNFPLSIFTGQVAAALAAGNGVIAKPAEQTPLIAAAAVRILHAAGVPGDVLQLLPGDGARIGTALMADARLAGVVFTGSTETAQTINRALAAREGALPALIAETGGLNAMIADSTALPEQVARDCLLSAFDSAGQRCSSLRVLFLQDDVADRIENLILGAMEELTIGDPFDLSTDIGPIIDEEARANLRAHAERMTKEAKFLRALPLPPECEKGVFFPPHVFAIPTMAMLKREVFGPILHIVRFSSGSLDKVCDGINASGYGLTLGVQSRIGATVEFVRARVRAGNIYVNRNQIGAVVGAQPFGGEGLSGTGPKAGGPHYLTRFARERSFAVNTAAAGGNAALFVLDED